MDLTYQPAQPPELSGIARGRVSLHDVLTLYRKQFWRWFAITAPTSLVAAAVLFISDQHIRAIFREIHRGEFASQWDKIAEAGVVRCGSLFISWFLGCFALAAIATVVRGLEVDVSSVWRSDSHQRAREHIGKLFLVALFTFCAFLVGLLALSLVELATVRAVGGWARFSRFNLAFVQVGYVVVAGILSWLGMTIPLILSGNIGVWPAFKKSLRISNGYEVFLFLLVIESLVGSYVAWYATHYGVALLFPPSLRFTAWYGWMVYVLFVLASAAVQPPMFLGFSLLADIEESPPSSFPCLQQTPHID